MDGLAATYRFFGTEISWAGLHCSPEIIAENSKRIAGRFTPTLEILNREPCAVVAYGPSLVETWQELREYKTIITCSGAHKFLLEHGITPTYHVESDPRSHKVFMLGEPCREVTYLPASICHADYIDKIAAFDVKLWHVLLRDGSMKFIPKGDCILTGGDTVGPRSIKIARLLGNVNLHLFGFDGAGRHAGHHTNAPGDSEYRKVRYEGKNYDITEHMMMHLDLLFQNLDRIPDISVTFHGEGLIQSLAKHWRYKFVPNFPLMVFKYD